MVEDDPLLSPEKTAEILHVVPCTLATWRCSGRGPRYVKIGRRVAYRESAIRSWLKSQERDPMQKQA